MRVAMMALALDVLLAVLLAVPLRAGDVPVDDLVTEARKHVHDYSFTPADSISGVIEKALPGVSGARDLFAIVRERFGLSDETSRLIGIAVLRNLIAEGSLLAQSEREREEVIRTLDVLYAAALARDPSNAAVAREYLVLIAGEESDVPNVEKRIRDVLRRFSRDRRGFVALQVMSDVRSGRANGAVFEALTESIGLDPLALAIVADDMPGSDNAELFDRACELWLARKDIDSASAAASRAIYAYSNRRALDDVLRIYRSLPAEGKAIVSSAPADEVTVRSLGIERRIGSRDVRITLAAAFILGGDPRDALPLLPAATSDADDPSDMAKAENESNAAMKGVIVAAIDPQPGDAFDLVIRYLRHSNEKATGLVDELFDRVATRAGYSAVSKWRLDGLARNEKLLSEQQRDPLPKEIAKLIPLTAAIPPVEPAVSPAVARLLAPKQRVSYVERPVDESARAISPRDGLAESRGNRVALPSAFHPLRAEAHGDEIVAVRVSQDVDPVGETSPGGYWIVRSTDRGATWNPPLYTGLRVMQPYEIVIGSTLPLVRRDGVRVEVVVNELDEESITFPPVALRAKQTREGIALDFTWRELERDSDRDGLTDLMEERILTDPNDADSDGDGVPDGADPLPQVAFRRSAGDVPNIIKAVLDAYYDPAPLRSAAESAKVLRPSRLGERTIFLAGDSADFAGVQTSLRTIVVSEADLEAASRKFGRILATHMSPIVIDQTGTRAWVEINDEWRGQTFLLEKENGVWIAVPVEGWIT